MTEKVFEYSQELLDSCAKSSLAQSILAKHGSLLASSVTQTTGSSHLKSDNQGSNESCLELFQQHAKHYGRQHDGIEKHLLEATIEELPKPLVRFVQSVSMVHQHAQTSSRMKLALNRFSDQEPQEDLPDEMPFERHLRGTEIVSWDGVAGGIDIGILTELSSAESILHVTANLGIGKGSMNALRPKSQGYKPVSYESEKKLHIPSAGTPVIFETPEVSDPTLDGNVLSIKKKRKEQPKEDTPKGPDEPGPGQHDPSTDENDGFATRIDWSTTNNPDGVPIVHSPIDQVRFMDTSEAAIARFESCFLTLSSIP